MSVYMAGIDYNRAGVDIRSRFAFTKKEMDEAFGELAKLPVVSGSVLLSTCNRTELWISTGSKTEEPNVKRILSQLKSLPYEENKEYLYMLSADEAVDHLFRLASGLESRILGEDQIITQVKDALGKSRENFAADHVLEVLFRQAVTAGKRVKSEVSLSTADRSVIHQAIEFLERNGNPVSGKKCLVIGNGMMGKLAATALCEAGADVTVTVRQYHSGTVEIPKGCERIDYEERFDLFDQCDMIVSATASPNLTIQKKHLQGLKIDHPVILIDLAVPRDIEISCNEVPGFTLYDIDSFEVDLTNAKLIENIKKAEIILNEEKEEFFDYEQGRDVLPLISEIKQEVSADINARLKPTYKKLSAAAVDSAEIEKEVGAAASRMMNKLLFKLKEELDADTYRECLSALGRVLQE